MLDDSVDCDTKQPLDPEHVGTKDPSEPEQWKQIKKSHKIWEFGGPTGTLVLMILFPLLVLVFAISLCDICEESALDIIPTNRTVVAYSLFCLFQFVLAKWVPGPVILGLPLEGGKQLPYLCNGVVCWYITLAVSVVLHASGVFPLETIYIDFAPLAGTAVMFGIFITVATYFTAVFTGSAHRMSGNLWYDMFMGAPLNPRLFGVDLKMWSEIRIPWVLLFYISLSCAVYQFKELGYVSAPIVFMVLAHFLYVNACMKGEECIPTTWDIFYEKWGFMLIFWNFAGVPFTYCFSSIYIVNRSFEGDPIELSVPYTVFCFALLLASYYVWFSN